MHALLEMDCLRMLSGDRCVDCNQTALVDLQYLVNLLVNVKDLVSEIGGRLHDSVFLLGINRDFKSLHLLRKGPILQGKFSSHRRDVFFQHLLE